jgi:hypothetical protein
MIHFERWRVNRKRADKRIGNVKGSLRQRCGTRCGGRRARLYAALWGDQVGQAVEAMLATISDIEEQDTSDIMSSAAPRQFVVRGKACTRREGHEMA